MKQFKKETRGGTRRNSGAKPKYNKQTKTSKLINGLKDGKVITVLSGE